MEYIQKFSLLNHTSKQHVLSLLSLALDSRRLDRPARQDVMTSARGADVSLLAQHMHLCSCYCKNFLGNEAVGS